jgi:catechol 2,3-dioxygenase-like lactoylglutathione lyase family enzyme
MAEAWRTIRVFISSTFRDMQAERDHLVRFVFPALRAALLARRVHLVDVDLRWGVTAEQDAFELCRDEIDRCHPRFVCILGGRYGWVPPPKTVAREALAALLAGGGAASEAERAALAELYEEDAAGGLFRLRARAGGGAGPARWNELGALAVEALRRAGVAEAARSITAAEIDYAALARLDAPAFRHFYFRDPAVTDSIPAPHADTYREPVGSFAESALRELKRRISESAARTPVAPGVEAVRPLPVFVYPCEWDAEGARVAGLKAFGARVYADLLASVEAELGEAEAGEPDEFAAERAAVEAFVESRVERYVVGSRGPVFERLREHAEGRGGGGYLCVVGQPGAGKSALLGKFYRDHAGGAATSAPGRDALVVAHFVGASAASTNVRQLLRRLCRELAEGAGLPPDVPDEFDKLREALPQLLGRAAETRRVLVVIDAVNQLDAAHGAQSMRWLPEELPAGARFILSALEGPALAALRARRRPPEEVSLRPLAAGDSAQIVAEFLGRYRKTLDGAQREALLSKRDAGLPLYLLAALEELRTLGEYDEITARIRELPEETRPLFHWVLARLEADAGFRDARGARAGPRLVRDYCSLVAAGRAGVAQSELAELCAPADEGGPADALGNVAALERLLRPYLMQRGELLDFFHGQLREAVEERYFREPGAREAAHHRLAEYFRRKADPTADRTWSPAHARALSELPYHQTEARLWDELFETLTDLAFLEAKCAHVAVSTADDARRTFGGVYELQEDYRRALEAFPSE